MGNEQGRATQDKSDLAAEVKNLSDIFPAFSKKKKVKKVAKLGEFRRQKLSYVFHQFFDMNHNGSVDWDDFDLARQHVCKLNGWKPDTDMWVAAEEIFKRLWELLQESADENKDGEITSDEWVKMWENVSNQMKIEELEAEMASEYVASPGPSSSPSPLWSSESPCESSVTNSPTLVQRPSNSSFRGSITSVSKLKLVPWLEKFIEYKFNLFDRTRDGVIDIEEFEYVLSDFGVPGRDARQAFILMTQNGELPLDYTYYKRLLLQFYFSDDNCSLGNFVTGKLDFERNEEEN